MDVTHALDRVAIAVVAVFLAQTALPQDQAITVRQVGKLQPRQAVERDLGPGQADVFTVSASAGQFVHVVAQQMGVDVAVSIAGADGKTIITGDSPNGTYGPEPASIIAPASGTYQVRVSVSEGPAGRYRIELSEPRKATDSDALRIRAEGLLPAAVAQADDKQKWPEVIRNIREAASVWHQLNDSYEEGLCLYELASFYRDLGDNQKGLESAGQAVPLLHAAGDAQGEGSALVKVGSIYWDLGEKRKALEFMEKAIPLLGSAGDRSSQAGVMKAVANICLELGQPGKTLDYLSQALSIFRALGDRSGEAGALHNLGKTHLDLGEKDKALDYYNQALSLRRTLGNRKGQASTLTNLGTLYAMSGDNRKAVDYYAQSVAISHDLGDREAEAAALLDLGKASSDLSDKHKAVELYIQSLSLYRALNDRSGEGRAMNNLGKVYSDLGENRKALEYHTEALALRRALEDSEGVATSLGNIGTVYALLAENQKALDYFEQALRIARESKDRTTEAVNLDNIGYVYSGLGDYRKALEYHARSLQILREMGDRAGESRAVNNVGAVNMELGQYREALKSFEQALALSRDTGDRIQEATTLNNIAMAYGKLGDPAKRLDYDNQSLSIAREVGDRPGEARGLNNLGLAYASQGDNHKALDFYIQSLPISRAAGLRSEEAITLSNISYSFKALGYPDAAIVFCKQAINILQSIRRDNRNLSEDLRHSYEKSIEVVYRTLAANLVERRRFGEAEEVLNLLKDKEAADFIRRDGVTDQLRSATLLESEKKALDRYEQVVGQVVALGQRKATLVAKSDTAALSAAEIEESARLDRDLAASNTVLLRFLDEQERVFAPGSAAAKRTGEFREAEGLEDALAKLGPDVVAIYTLVVADKYIAMLITSGARKVYTTPIKEEDLNSKIFAFRQVLQNPASDPLPLARELYRIVFPEGLRQDLDAIHVNTIMWSVDGTLRYIPIPALHDGKEYIVKRFRNSLITPASLARLTEPSAKVWDGIGFGVSEAQANFAALPSVPEELHGIFRQNATDGAPLAGTVLLDAQFTRSAFEQDLSARRNRVVHIATHFDSNPGVAANSNLLLGDGTKLSLAEIEAQPRLFNGVDLLTLSACSTAFTNRTEDGREIDSFGTIAQRLGAKGVIASLWSVNDMATARLMETMYRLRQQNPALGKSEALRQAQAQMISGELRPADESAKAGRGVVAVHPVKARDWSHPFYWAPFILIGNWL